MAEQKKDDKSRTEYTPGGLKDQPPEFSEGTLTTRKGYTSPGKTEGKEISSQPGQPEKGETGPGRESSERSSNKTRQRYLLTLPHQSTECQTIKNEIVSDISDWEWGCDSGDHTGYLTITAENELEVLSKIPDKYRGRARVTLLKQEAKTGRGKR